MAKRQTKKAATTKGASLPKGFKAISGFGGSWDFKKERVLIGNVVGFKTIDSQYKDDRGKPKKQRIATIRRADKTEVSVFESGALRPLFDLKKGTKVAIVFRGLKKIKGRKQPMKDFEIGVA